jgi:hypothetical protein
MDAAPHRARRITQFGGVALAAAGVGLLTATS